LAFVPKWGKICSERKINMKNLLNKKLFELFELFDKKVRNYSLFDKFLNHYLNPSLAGGGNGVPPPEKFWEIILFTT
jgi:hypothetical protein